jgi:hypothetical protein
MNRSEPIDNLNSRKYVYQRRCVQRAKCITDTNNLLRVQCTMQIDMEMSCIVPADIFRIVERIIRTLWKNERGIGMVSMTASLTGRTHTRARTNTNTGTIQSCQNDSRA